MNKKIYDAARCLNILRNAKYEMNYEHKYLK